MTTTLPKATTEAVGIEGERVRYLGDLHRIDRKAGDVFVLSVDADISAAVADNITQIWQTKMGDAPLLILTRGMKLGAINAVETSMIAALEPFAAVADEFDADGRELKDSDGIYANTAGDFRRAREALALARSKAKGG
jgi:hypothetical protein